MHRRAFLKYLLGGSSVSFLSIRRTALAASLSFSPTDAVKKITARKLEAGVANLGRARAPHVTHAVNVLRPDDLLNLRFEFVNLALSINSKGSNLVRIAKSKPAYVRVVFPPQHITEQIFQEGIFKKKSEASKAKPPIGSHIAGESRLVFSLPKGVDSIPYKLHTLLSWEKWKPSLSPLALPPDYPLSAKTAQDAVAGYQKSTALGQFGGYPVQLPHISVSKAGGQGIRRLMNPGEFNAKVDYSLAFKPKPKTFVGVRMQILIPRPLKENETAIEAPARLILSPHKKSAWAHAKNGAKKDAKTARTELWHTRLGALSASGGVDENNEFLRTVRAVWSTDYNKGKGDKSCGLQDRTETLTKGERYQIVSLSSDFAAKEQRAPIRANHLMLSALGSWLDLRGDWTLSPGSKYGLESWTHRTTQGRDQFVRVVCKGYLFPFGHRAAKITITERRIENSPAHAAYLHVYSFVVVKEPVKQYSKEATSTDRHAVEGRRFPFGTVRLKTLVTPHLNPPIKATDRWLKVDNKDFQFEIEAEDWDGRRCQFTAPLAFIPNTMAEGDGRMHFADAKPDPASLDGIKVAYNSGTHKARRERPMAGQKIAYAPSSQDQQGDTSFETNILTLGAGVRTVAAKGELRFYPTINNAKVRLAAASQLTGNDTGITFSLFDSFINSGFKVGKNSHGEVFAYVPTPPGLNFPNDRAGGVISPNMAIRGLSRKFGILGGTTRVDDPHNLKKNAWYQDLNSIAAGNLGLAPTSIPGMDPKKFAESFFARLFKDAKLLGSVSLGDLITLSFGQDGRNIPKFQSVPLYNSDGDIIGVDTNFVWKPEVQTTGPFIANRATDTGTIDAAMSVVSHTVASLDQNGKPTVHSTTKGTLENFSIELLPGDGDSLKFILVSFKSLTFTSTDAQKTDFSVSGVDVKFLGDLAFVNSLQKYIGSDGNNKDLFNDPPSLSVTSDGIRLGYTLGLPDVGVGAFSLQNMSVSAALSLPFTGGPMSVHAAFSERDDPFTVTYTIFGGGGFFGITVGTSGLQVLEAALEFGGNCALSLGVASGKAYLMVGVYFSIDKDNNASLDGYVRSGAALQVLGLITVSVQFRFDLEYESGTHSAKGTGTLTIEVDVAFFSKSVDVTFSKSFAGGAEKKKSAQQTGLLDGDSHDSLAWLDDAVPADADEWCEAYCDAFAGEAA